MKKLTKRSGNAGSIQAYVSTCVCIDCSCGCPPGYHAFQSGYDANNIQRMRGDQFAFGYVEVSNSELDKTL